MKHPTPKFSPWTLDDSNTVFKALPFPRVFVKDFVNPAIFPSLSEQFPSTDFFRLIKDYKYRLQSNYPEFKNFMATSPAWSSFLESVMSQEFVDRVQHLLLSGFKKNIFSLVSNPSWFSKDLIRRARRWKLAGSGKIGRFDLPVRVTVEFAKVGGGMQIEPHNDSGGKIVSFLLYLPTKDWKPDYGGGTQFYFPKNKKFNFIFADPARYLFEDMVVVDETRYESNNAAFFLKTANSLHGVKPNGVPMSCFRNSVSIFIVHASGSKLEEAY